MGIGIDKLEHFFLWGTVMMVLFPIVGNKFGTVVMVLWAISKELIYDGVFKKGTPELLDCVFGLLPVMYYWILFYANKFR